MVGDGGETKQCTLDVLNTDRGGRSACLQSVKKIINIQVYSIPKGSKFQGFFLIWSLQGKKKKKKKKKPLATLAQFFSQKSFFSSSSHTTFLFFFGGKV